MFDEYDCNKICNCREPDFNDAIINSETDCLCIHCDICGGVPATKIIKCEDNE